MQKKNSDLFLLESMIQGDQKSFDEIFLLYYTPLVSFSISLGLKPEQAEDTVADLFTELWYMRQRLHIHTSLKAYLYASARNKANMLFRSQRVEFLSEHEAYTLQAEPWAQPDERLFVKDKQQWVEKIAAKLPEQTRVIFLLRWQHQLSDREVAEILQKNVHTVRTLLYRAIRYVREQMEKVK